MTQRKRVTDRVRAVGTHIKSNQKKYAGGTAAAVVAMVLGLQATGTINTFSLEALNNFFNFDNSTNIDNSQNIDNSINQTIEVHQDGDTYVVTYPDGTTRTFDSIEDIEREHPEWESSNKSESGSSTSGSSTGEMRATTDDATPTVTPTMKVQPSATVAVVLTTSTTQGARTPELAESSPKQKTSVPNVELAVIASTTPTETATIRSLPSLSATATPESQPQSTEASLPTPTLALPTPKATLAPSPSPSPTATASPSAPSTPTVTLPIVPTQKAGTELGPLSLLDPIWDPERSNPLAPGTTDPPFKRWKGAIQGTVEIGGEQFYISMTSSGEMRMGLTIFTPQSVADTPEEYRRTAYRVADDIDCDAYPGILPELETVTRNPVTVDGGVGIEVEWRVDDGQTVCFAGNYVQWELQARPFADYFIVEALFSEIAERN